MGGKKTDLTGHRYGRLLAVRFEKTGKHYTNYWKCICDCGNVSTVSIAALRSGGTKSCGCLSREKIVMRRTKHGETKGPAGQKKNYHPLYGVWCSMRSRCFCETDHAFKNYGARGISVCQEWINDFLAFKNWCLFNGWRKGLQLDRVDNNGNYQPDNCRFVTPKVNCNNKRVNVMIEFNGTSRTLGEWATFLGLKYTTLRARIFDHGYSIEKALTPGLFKTNGIIIQEI